jgi:hypothetical protein
MISFFRKVTAYKYIVLFFIFLALRLPFLFRDIPLTVFELNWILVAERLSKGFVLYKQIWDDISPLSAFVYWWIYIFFGKSQLALHLIATILIFIQAILFNEILKERRTYTDLTLVPALLYILLMSSFIEFLTLTPALMANTFLLLAIRYMFLHISEAWKHNAVFEVGAYLGLSSLFYLPSALLIAVPIVSFIFFTGTKFKDYLLMIFAFLFTIFTSFLIFYIFNSEYEYYLHYYQSIFYLGIVMYVSWTDILLWILFPTILFIWNLGKAPQYRRYTNYQNRCVNMMMLWALVALASVFLNSKLSISAFTIGIPALAFLLTHFFYFIRSTLVREAVFLAWCISTFFVLYSSLTNFYIPIRVPFLAWKGFDIGVNMDKMTIRQHPQIQLIKNKKVLVLGNDYKGYLNAHAASPYLNWRLAQRHLGNINQYFNIKTQVYQNIFDNPQKDIPDVIIDENGYASQLFKEMPIAAQHYEKLKGTNLYLRMK